MKSLILATFLLATSASAVYRHHVFTKIDTCYHWLNYKKTLKNGTVIHPLEAKIKYAEANNGDLQFYGGKVIYCWRSPIGAESSWEPHGDVLLRIKLKPGTKVLPAKRAPKHLLSEVPGQLAAAYSKLSQDNPKKYPPGRDNWKKYSVIYAKYQKNSAGQSWQEYTITPEAVESWSINHPNTNLEMKAEFDYYESRKNGAPHENDIFYPIEKFNYNWTRNFVEKAIVDHRRHSDDARIFGENPENHFVSRKDLPWMKPLDKSKFVDLAGNGLNFGKIEIVEASWGVNLDKDVPENPTREQWNNSKFHNNLLGNAKVYCDGKTFCGYKVLRDFFSDEVNQSVPKFDEDGGYASQSFYVRWKCSNLEHIRYTYIAKDSYEQTFKIHCYP